MSINTEQRVTRLVESTAGVSRRALPASRLIDDLGFDSIMMVELMTAVEDEFDLVITLDDATRIETVANLQQTVTEALARRDREASDVAP